MNPLTDLSELQFTHRAFLAYLNDLLISQSRGRTLVDNQPINNEITRAEKRVEDLDILIKRKRHEA